MNGSDSGNRWEGVGLGDHSARDQRETSMSRPANNLHKRMPKEQKKIRPISLIEAFPRRVGRERSRGASIPRKGKSD